MLARVLDRGDQVEIVRQLGRIRQKHVQAPFPAPARRAPAESAPSPSRQCWKARAADRPPAPSRRGPRGRAGCAAASPSRRRARRHARRQAHPARPRASRPSGMRKPIGESPAVSTSRSGRGNHSWLDQLSCAPPAAGGESAGCTRPALLRVRIGVVRRQDVSPNSPAAAASVLP
jgi:hypothetical protein